MSWVAIYVRVQGTDTPLWGFNLLIPTLARSHFQLLQSEEVCVQGQGGGGLPRGAEQPSLPLPSRGSPPYLAREPKHKWRKNMHLTGRDSEHVRG